MKKYETRVIPERTEQCITGTVCDLCGAKSFGVNWDQGYYKTNETEVSVHIKHETGISYPEGGSGTNYEIDMCPKCFQDKLIPWVKSQGGNVRETDWDF